MGVLTRSDCDIHYEVQGSGPALLFIHGLGSCQLDWEKQVDAFRDRFMVITSDLRGHGRSGRPRGPYSIATFAEDQIALLRELGVASADVVGLSLGGAVAFQLALDAPELVRKLVIVNSDPDFVLRTLAQRLFVWQRTAMIKWLSFERMGKLVAAKMFPGPDQEEVRRIFVERYARNEKGPYLDSLNALFGWTIADRLDELRCAILVVAADQDYSPLSRKQAYVAKLAVAKLVLIEDAGHATPMERPGRFNAVLRDFLEEAAEVNAAGAET
jgi:3-oxoadipate enol-lactonase